MTTRTALFPDWSPFEQLVAWVRHRMEPAHTNPESLDRLRDGVAAFLDEVGVDRTDEFEMRAVMAGIALVTHASHKVVRPFGQYTTHAVTNAAAGLLLNMPETLQ